MISPHTVLAVLAGGAVFSLLAYAFCWRGAGARTPARVAAFSFVCATGATILGLSPWAAVPLLVASAAGYVVALGGER